MCDRYAVRRSLREVAEAFRAISSPTFNSPSPRDSVAPTQNVPIVRFDPDKHREVALVRWGWVPAWADDPAIGNRMINARAEGVATKPSFRHAFRRRRCLVVADGFYEWKRVGDKKQPSFIRLKDDGLFGMAGLGERWERPGEKIESCTIITTEADQR